MSFQFAHIESYSRKPNKRGVNVRYVIAEAKREAGSCEHVENPEAPSLVYGITLDELEALHDEMANRATMTNSKGQSRKIRQDQRTLMTVVLSHPGDDAVPTHFDDGTPQAVASVEEWRERSIQWLRAKYGDDLKTVIEHTDEGHPHLHAYILPSGPQMLARDYHPGEQAKAESMAGDKSIEANREGDKAYRSAMREWQNDYYREVGQPCGLARIGPGRRRLSRAEWQAEQQSQQTVRVALEQSQEITSQAKQVEESAKHEAKQIIGDAEKKAEQVQALANEILREAEEQKTQIHEDARKEGLRDGASDFASSDLITRVVLGASMKALNLREEGKREGISQTAKKAKETIKKWEKNDKQQKEKIKNITEERDNLKESLKEYTNKSYDNDNPIRDLKRQNEQLQSYLGVVFESLDMHGINPCPFIKVVYTFDDLMRDCDRIAKEWLESYRANWEPKTEYKKFER